MIQFLIVLSYQFKLILPLLKTLLQLLNDFVLLDALFLCLLEFIRELRWLQDQLSTILFKYLILNSQFL